MKCGHFSILYSIRIPNIFHKNTNKPNWLKSNDKEFVADYAAPATGHRFDVDIIRRKKTSAHRT